ncbi:MAG: patatin-like phospholipase family protein [Methylococcaceae bacterium]|nr:patatin-like phospholipase family protein [Methylococcaceae bacterium]
MSYTKYDLVFEGGGAKGSTFVGAMQAFYEKGLQPRRLIGTSAGAITATLLAAGFTPEEMLVAVNEQVNGKPRFATFMDTPTANDFSATDKQSSVTIEVFQRADIPFIPDWMQSNFDQKFVDALLKLPHYRQLFCFIECGGLFAGNKFLEWIQEKLAQKGFNADVTFATFHAKTGKDLSLVASNTTSAEMLVLNHRTAPDCPITWAVRMSMSIPFVWREVIWQKSWGAYLGRDITGHSIVDGGVLSNFPIRLVDTQPQQGSYEQRVMGDTVANDAGTIGLLIDETLEVAGQPKKSSSKMIGEFKTAQRILRLVNTMTDAHDNNEILTNEQLVCRLPAQGYGTTEFNMDSNRLNALIEAGHAAMRNYLK